MREYLYYVYILASGRNGTLYIGVTNNLGRRVFEHRQGEGGKFTKKYRVTRLVYFEEFDEIQSAIHREDVLKRYKRSWKINLIQRENEEWRDLAEDWYTEDVAPAPLSSTPLSSAGNPADPVHTHSESERQK